MASKLQSIQKGSQIIDQIFWELLKILKSRRNLTELALARRIRKLAKDLGAQGLAFPPIVSFGKGLAFPPIVSFGKSSAEIHHKPGKNIIGTNNFLMLDYGVKVNGYCSDFTRTLFLGRPTNYHKKIYNIVLNAQLTALKKVQAGADCVDIDLIARNIIAKAGFAKNYNHSTGHAVGRKIHEPPSFSPISKEVLSKDTIMTVEPGIYLPKKFGVRIEDMVLVTSKPKVFSKISKNFSDMIM